MSVLVMLCLAPEASQQVLLQRRFEVASLVFLGLVVVLNDLLEPQGVGRQVDLDDGVGLDIAEESTEEQVEFQPSLRILGLLVTVQVQHLFGHHCLL